MNSGRLELASDMRIFGWFVPRNVLLDVLVEIAGGSVNLPLLPVGSGKHLNLGADRALVVVESFQRESQPVVLIAAFIAQQDSGTVVLGNEQVGSAITVVVAGNQRA